MEKIMNNYNPMHVSVLLKAVVKHALPKNGKIFADCTFGLGGHTKAILEEYPQITKVFAVDRDGEILNYSIDKISDPRISRFQAKASELPDVLKLTGCKGVDGILLDLGVSSYQLDNHERGFSFMRSGPLDMRMDKRDGNTAENIVNTYEKSQLEHIFFEYGEEKFARRIADAIIRKRSEKTITTTEELAKIISDAVPAANKNKKQIHPATRVFQALRIEVNNELGEIEDFLTVALDCLNPGGHLSIIAFHSLEDRLVKNFMQKYAKGCDCPPKFPVCVCGKKPMLELLTKKAIFADEDEIAVNPRSRSARLRCAKKCLG
ncbi:MAG: 16S rRNA (cytosine(1402)-N(4))-methyltransferase RsmH [Candidatus Riflebacteria bacterium]|nr:16S rRNA (cytosine(1402)-N(4))-methyltransferase RsmH [Candidatus Riflebacteria bacterium]